MTLNDARILLERDARKLHWESWKEERIGLLQEFTGRVTRNRRWERHGKLRRRTAKESQEFAERIAAQTSKLRIS